MEEETCSCFARCWCECMCGVWDDTMDEPCYDCGANGGWEEE